MPTMALVKFPRPRWLPPIPLPLFLLWPFVLMILGIARLLEKEQPQQAQKLRTAMNVFCELRGLAINMNTAAGKQVRIRFI